MTTTTRRYIGFCPMAITAILMVAACSTVQSGYTALTPGLEAWAGHSTNELIASWGQPESRTDLGDDVEALTWVSDDGHCEHTFTTRNDKVIGVSDNDCSD